MQTFIPYITIGLLGSGAEWHKTVWLGCVGHPLSHINKSSDLWEEKLTSPAESSVEHDKVEITQGDWVVRNELNRRLGHPLSHINKSSDLRLFYWTIEQRVSGPCG